MGILMKPNLYEIWFADIEYTDNKGIYDNRPVFVLRKEGSKYVVLKGTTSSETKEPFYQIEDLSECGLHRDTKIILSRKYIIPEKYFTKYVGQVSDNDLVNIVSSLLSQKIYAYFQEKLILDESLFENISVEKQLPQYLYHATYPHRWKMIKQAGGLKTHLNRRLRNWSDSRDVICLSEDPDVAESYAETALDELDKDWDIVILKIDTKYLDKNYLSYDANILYDEDDAEEGFEQTEYEYSKDIPLEAISLTLVEAAKRKKRKKRVSNVKAGDSIFNSVNDMKKWVKKRQKGLSPFCYLNPNAGNVPLSNTIFNSMFSSDGSSGVGTSEGGISNGGLIAGDAGAGMGESFNPDLKLKLHYTRSLSDYLTDTEQDFIRNNMDLINSESWVELRDKVDNTFDYPLTTIAIFKFLADGLGYDFTYFEELLKLE